MRSRPSKIRKSGGLIEKYFTNVNNNYPENTMEAYNLLVKYKTSFKPETVLVDDSEEVSFANFGGSEGNSNSY